jgi:predicted amidohydrolase
MKINTACIQINSNDDIAANIARVEALVGEAKKKGAEFVALPENVFCMEKPGAKRTLYKMSEHPGIAASSRMAKAHAIWLLVGSLAIAPEKTIKQAHGDKTFNRSLLFNPRGEMVAAYDKIHLFDVEVGDGQSYKESAKILPGEKLALGATPWGKIGMTVCYDVRFPQLYRALAKAGAVILVVPAAFTAVTGEAHWHVLLRARAIESGCFVIAPAQTGTHPGDRKTFGHSLIIDPWGKILADGGTEEGVVMAEIDLDEVKKVRAKIPSLEHDRKFN